MERFCLEIAIHLLRQWLLNNWFGWPTYSRPACRHVSHVECILQCSLQCTKRWRQAVMSVDFIQQTNPVQSNFHHPRYTRQILRKSEMRSFQLSLRSRQVTSKFTFLRVLLRCAVIWRCYLFVMSVDLIQQINPVKSNFHHPRYTRQILRKSEMRSFQLSLRSRQVTSKFTFLRVLLRCAVIWRCYFFSSGIQSLSLRTQWVYN